MFGKGFLSMILAVLVALAAWELFLKNLFGPKKA